MKTIRAPKLRAPARRKINSTSGHSTLPVNGKHRSPIRSSKLEVLPPVKKLKDKERERLAAYEAVIETNLQQFVEVVLALKKIKDAKLYREYGEFEDYCRIRFDFGRAHGYRMLASAKVIADLQKLQSDDGEAGQKSPNGDILLPRNEAQARELARIKQPKKRLEVLKLVAKETGHAPLNAAVIREAVTKLKLVPAKPAGQNSYYEPARYNTDLKIFLQWLERLKKLADDGKKSALMSLLKKAIKDKAILPEMPEMVFIRGVDEQHGWMGNMSAHSVIYQNQTFRTTEALFQWLRFDGHPEIQKRLIAEKSPMAVKMVAKKHRRLLVNPDSAIDLKMMRQCLKLKIEQHAKLKEKLLATGDKLIVEDCSARPRGDAFYWGMALIAGQWVGENHLGELWVKLREQEKII
jgi:ribA/ribD-fused uncharacterized protein